VSAKDKKSEVFRHFKKVKGEFFARSYNISLKKGLSLAFVLTQMYAC